MIQKTNISPAIEALIQERDDAYLWLYNGDVGLILYYYYKSLYSEDEASQQQAFTILEKQFHNIKEYPYNYKFGYGIPGFTWLVQFLINENCMPKKDAAILDEIDTMIEKAIDWNLEDGLYDLFIGTIGKSVFFFERLNFAIEQEDYIKVEKYKSVLTKVVQNLDDYAVKTEQGTYWLDHYTSLYNDVRKGEPFAGIGLSHGVPSIIHFLGSCHRLDIAPTICKRLIAESITWVQNQEKGRNQFPSKVYPDGKTIDSGVDLSWCYGLFSVAASFWIAGKTLKSEDLIDKAISVVTHAANIELEDYNTHLIEGNQNIFFCHGTAGFSFLFRKFHQLTGIPAFKNRADEWLAKTITEVEKYDPELLRSNSASLLDGLIGVDLVIRSHEAPDKNTNWEKLFLLDLNKF